MLSLSSRAVILQSTVNSKILKLTNFSKLLQPAPAERITKKPSEQVEYIKSAIKSNKLDWPSIKINVLAKHGAINQKNFEGVMFRTLVSSDEIDAAVSFAKYLKIGGEEMSIGSINGLLSLYFRMSKTQKLSDEERASILGIYNSLYEKYKVLDFTTSERLLEALCVIDEWEKALKVLGDIYLSGVPSHVAYSTLIGALFRNNKKKKALEIIKKSVDDKRPLKYMAFEEWIKYILRKYRDKKTILKYLDEIYVHISKNCNVIDECTAVIIKETFESLDWQGKFTKINKSNGQCMNCNERLECLDLSDEEFLLLQQNVKDKLIVGSDLFLKTSPEELKRFMSFVSKTAPYDVIIDALNVAYAVGKGNQADRLSLLLTVVDYFKAKNKKILLLGRKHLLKWGKGSVERLKSGIHSFFTNDLSQDDPYFITAAIISGPHTDFVTKDLLRGHTFMLKDEKLQNIFKRWQWQHQWMIYLSHNRRLMIQPPLTFTPCAQKKIGWHLPYEKSEVEDKKQLNITYDGVPDLNNWLCISPRKEVKK